MKKLHLLLLGLTICLFSACHDKLWDAIDGLDARVAKLEELCKEMNTNITSLQTIVDVLQANDYITGIVEIKKNGEVIGYTITFGKHEPITIYHGQDGKDGQNGADGKDGITPVIGVAQDTDGVYYWTLNGEWLLDDNGNKFPVSGKDGQNGTNGSNGQDGEDGKDGADGQDGKDGITPQLKIEEGYWYISYDNGTTWTQLGKATGEDGKDGANGKDGQDGQNGADGKDGQDGDSMFQSVTQDENYVYFTLADGTVIKIAKGNSNNQSNDDFIFTITYDANGGLGSMAVDTIYYGYSTEIKACTFTREGYSFVEWNTDKNGKGAPYQTGFKLTIEKKITLYAQWEENLETTFIFSVDDGRKVIFSKGNLQYTRSTNTWSFAENQWDYIGLDNVKGGSVSSNQYIGEHKTGTALADKIDLFGWSTSATNFGANISEEDKDYSGSFVDWGTNQIGADAPNTWRTLTYHEWNYLNCRRTNADSLQGIAQVNGVNGLIFLPDNWTCPASVTFKPGKIISNVALDSYEEMAGYAQYQTFTADQWSKLEDAGAVFLPAAGGRYGTSAKSAKKYGSYWSSTYYSVNTTWAGGVTFNSQGMGIGYYPRHYGSSVRLVKDL